MDDEMNNDEITENGHVDKEAAVDAVVALADAEAADASADGDGEGAGDELQMLEWDGDQIEFPEAMRQRGHAYGSYVNTSRAIPDVRDGFKPVQRRIIVAMSEEGARAGKPYRKSAKTVGSVMGNYHPHGDAAIYDAMVRLAQDFQCAPGATIVDGQGNWGNVDGDPAAASRYTEARLSPLATSFLTDLHDEIVPYRPNFSEERTEPVALPVTAPMLLCLGISGIGWSMASSIPPHNLGEAIDAAILIAEKPDATLDQLMKRLPGPDFVSGGVIVNPDALKACFGSGQGTVKLQGRFHLETVGSGSSGQQMIITELPYQVSPADLVRQIVQAARDGKITEITEMPKNLVSKDGLKIQVRCKRGGNVQKMVQDVLTYTNLRTTISYNMTVLVDGKPRVVSMKEALENFVQFRLDVVTGRLELERRELHRRLHLRLGVLAALDAVDEVIKIIRNANDDADAKAKLIARLKYTPHGEKKPKPIDDEQAHEIITTQLRRIARLNKYELEAEAKAWGDRIDEITAILQSETGVRDIVVDELKATRKEFAQSRRTALEGVAIDVATDADPAAIGQGPATPVTLYVASSGFGMTVPRTGKVTGSAQLSPGAGSRLILAEECMSDVMLLALTASGQAIRVPIGDVPPDTRRGKGRAMLAITKGDEITWAGLDNDRFTHVLMITDRGTIKRVERALLSAAHSGGVPIFKLPDGERLIVAVAHNEGDEIIMATQYGRALRIGVEKIRAVQSGTAGGVAGMRLDGDDVIVAACRADGDFLLTVHETGFAKRVPLADYPTKGRGGGGVGSASPEKPSKNPALDIVWAGVIPGSGELALVCASGSLLKVDISTTPEATRAGVSKPALALGPGDTITGIYHTAE